MHHTYFILKLESSNLMFLGAGKHEVVTPTLDDQSIRLNTLL